MRLFSWNFITTTPSTGINVSNENPCSSPSTTTIKKFPSWEFNVYFNIVHLYFFFVVFVPVNDIIDFIPLKRPLELLCWVMLCYLWWMSGFANVCGIDTHKLNSIWLNDFQINLKKKNRCCVLKVALFAHRVLCHNEDVKSSCKEILDYSALPTDFFAFELILNIYRIFVGFSLDLVTFFGPSGHINFILTRYGRTNKQTHSFIRTGNTLKMHLKN